MNDEERDNVENGYEWEVESEDGSDVEPDTFSWVDPSIIGSEAFRRSVSVQKWGSLLKSSLRGMNRLRREALPHYCKSRLPCYNSQIHR